MSNQKIIYDIGAYEGGDLDYYLKKADQVIAIEANPVSADKISSKYKSEIIAGNLIVVNKAILVQDGQNKISFYVHKYNSALSSIIEPPPGEIQHFEKIDVETISVSDLFKTYGHPYFVKIDIEKFDYLILKELMSNKIFPDYFSVEIHLPEILGLFLTQEVYNSFNIVRGYQIGTKYKKLSFLGKDGRRYTTELKPHFAGPFGEEIKDNWYSKSDIIKAISIEGFGWCDLHARKNPSVSELTTFQFIRLFLEKVARHFTFKLRKIFGK